MSAPLKTLSCVGINLELYPGCLLIHPVGWLGHVYLVEGRAMLIQYIQKIHLSSAGLTHGSICITPNARVGKSIYGIFPRCSLRAAEAFYETLYTLVNPKGVLEVAGEIESPERRSQ